MAKKNPVAEPEPETSPEPETYSVRLHNPDREDRLPVIRVQASRIPNSKGGQCYQSRVLVYQGGDVGKGAKYIIKGFSKHGSFAEAKAAAEAKLNDETHGPLAKGFVFAEKTTSGTVHEGLDTLLSTSEYAAE